MTPQHQLVDGIHVPRFLYGTAWKEAETGRLTRLAIDQGFRGIDTANQRVHYHEASVGEALVDLWAEGQIRREDLFLQTKFTFRGGQDHRLPYDPSAPVPEQVEQSFASSLTHLHTDFLDSYVLHGPTRRVGLGPEDWEAWRAIESLKKNGRTRLVGVSNFSLKQLETLCREADVKPHFVQNRCFAVQGWDRQVREFCAANRIVYQGFSLLTANHAVLGHPEMVRIAKRHGRGIAQIVFRFALDVGMIPLTGTTNAQHMRDDLEVFDFELEPREVAQIERLGTI